MDKQTTDLVYGKDATTNITSIEFSESDCKLYLFKNDKSYETRDYEFYVLTPHPITNLPPNIAVPRCEKLDGELHYKFKYTTKARRQLFSLISLLKERRIDYWSCYNTAESAMINTGLTLFKGLQLDDVDTLFFDIEGSGLERDKNSKVFIISNYLTRKNQEPIVKMFSVDDYASDKEMIADWCKWVCEVDPCVIAGHNIFSYDLPYLQYVYGNRLPLGRLNRNMVIEDYERRFRKDGSQTYPYNDCLIFGRQVIDTFFLSIKYDFKRQFPSYGLKNIIKYLKFEKPGRQHYDASKIAQNWDDLNERSKIKDYARDDAEDAYKIYNYMVPSFFYFTQHVPKTFQQINNSATGAQINSFLIRSYLQINHSIPKDSSRVKYSGAISFGIPGVYQNCFKIDVSSLYPSIMIQYEIYDKEKDPNQHFFKMVKHFTFKRLEYKKLGEETNNKMYKDLDSSSKIFINSAYGLLGASGLHFNSPKLAAFITEQGRNILKTAIKWATGKEDEFWVNHSLEEDQDWEIGG